MKFFIPLALLFTAAIPTSIFMLFGTSSTAPGTLICAGAWIMGALLSGRAVVDWRRQQWNRVGVAVLVVTLLFLHGVAVELWLGGVDFTRLTASCAALLAILGAAYVISDLLLSVPAEVLGSAGRSMYLVLTVIGICAVAGVPSVNGAAFWKPMIVFSEPSQFSMVYLPLLIFTVATATGGRQLLILGLALVLTAELQNLTMLVGILAASALVLRRFQLLVLVGIIALIGAFVALDLSYYASRLVLSANTDNLSTLVYLQGWERVVLNFKESGGLGVGFQQFGFVGSLGDLAERITQIVGMPINLYDGGSTGSKLIAELGVVGLLAIIWFLTVVFRAIAFIRRSQRLPVQCRDARPIFFYSFAVAYTSELFLRGNGYLSPSATFLLVALISIARLRIEPSQASEPLVGRSVPTSA